jgi:class 3 adenylate cyclase
MSANSQHISTSIILNASLERLWPLISDTDRVNRMLGLPAFERTTPNDELVQTINGHYLGVPVSWREHPFEWVYQQYFSVRREFNPPLPFDWLTTDTQLTPIDDSSTRVVVNVYLGARNIIGRIGGPLVIGQQMLRDMRRVYRQFGELAANAAAAAYELPPLRKPVVQSGRLEFALARLREFPVRPALIDRLASHLRGADDADVVKMRPFTLADRWDAPRLEVLRTFLYATRSGLLDLEWDVICPSCRGASVRTTTLATLSHEAHCPSCNVRYGLNFDESVELRFSVNPTIREAVDLSYCIGGPANTRHIVAQLRVEPQQTREITLRLAPGRYRLRSRRMEHTSDIVVSPDTTAAVAAVRFGGEHAEAVYVAPGEVTLQIANDGAERTLIVIEDATWSDQAASAALVTTLEEFRQLFSSEVLAPDLGLAVRNLTFLFSDLKDSTAIYDRLGDSPAYARVRDHFTIMREIIAQHNGSLVKTIGDAVMAVFTQSDQAIAAAIAIQKIFTEGEIARGNPALRVKLGLHRGPCIAVNANDLLDYFGSTVNVAARVQSESIGGDIVITDDLLADPVVRQVIEASVSHVESFDRSLKGISQVYALHRLWVMPVEMMNSARAEVQSVSGAVA